MSVLCKDCGKHPREKDKVRCHWCSTRVWQRSIKYTEKQKFRAMGYMGGKCYNCGLESQIPDIYDFHHVNPEEKESALNELLGKIGWETVRQELDKCVMLCANCHRTEHYYQRKQNEQKRIDFTLPKPNSKKWTDEETAILSSLSGRSMKEAEKLLPRWSMSQIKNKSFELGISLKPHKTRDWSEQELEKLSISFYQNQTVRQVWNQFKDRSLESIKTGLSLLNLCYQDQSKDNFISEVNFEEMTEAKAYLLGIVWARGGFTKRGTAVYAVIKDPNLLNAITNMFNLRYKNQKIFMADVVALKNMGLTNKTYPVDVAYPLIDKVFDPYFIRGFFDSKVIINEKDRNICFSAFPFLLGEITKRARCKARHTERTRILKGKERHTYETSFNRENMSILLDYIDVDLPCTNNKFLRTKKILDNTKNKPWSTTEEELLKQHYTEDIESILKLFPDRSYGSIFGALRRLQLNKRISNRWTVEEEQLLFSVATKKEACELLSRHSPQSVYAKAVSLGIEFKKGDSEIVSEKERGIIIEAKNSGKTVSCIAKALGISRNAVANKIKYLIQTTPLEERCKYNLVTLTEKKLLVSYYKSN
jgi:hypothetical protein